jgi:GT2 family glycosyltransferase
MSELEPAGKIKVTLVTPVYNRRETTLQALRSLSRIDKTGMDVRIIVVDDASPDKTGEAIKLNYPDVQVIYGDGTLHYAAGTNRGISAALANDPDYIVCMNDDAIFHEQFLQRLIKTARENPRSIVGALLLLWDEPHKVFQVAPKWNAWDGGWDLPLEKTAFDFPREAFEVEGIVGNCLLYPAEAIRQCGLMDEKKFPHGWGDLQYTVRMKKMGWKLLIEPRALVWNEPNTYPQPLHRTSPVEILRNLFVNQHHPLNLGRQFTAIWESAPSKSQATIAYVVYLFRLGKKSVRLGFGRRFGRL